MSTFGVIISNRSFFPDHLVRTAREKLMAAMEQWGHQVIALSPEDTFLGQTMTYEEAKKCAALFRAHSAEIEGVIVCLPNFGEETGVADAIKMSGLNGLRRRSGQAAIGKPPGRLLRQAFPVQQSLSVRHPL